MSDNEADKEEFVKALSTALALAVKNDVYWLWPINPSDLGRAIESIVGPCVTHNKTHIVTGVDVAKQIACTFQEATKDAIYV
jgi:hypothetical protein